MNMRPICVFGVLLTEEGKKIKAEMLEWLEPIYEVHLIEQEPPGKLFEYPAIKEAIELSIERNLPVLYIHTKGAANPVPSWAERMMNEKFDIPKSAKLEDCQKTIRNLWKNEFTGDRLTKYLDRLNTEKATVCCPYTGIQKWTWFNAWMINPTAAKLFSNRLRFSDYRWYYERIFEGHNNIDVVGMRFSNLYSNTFDENTELWNDIWSFYEG